MTSRGSIPAGAKTRTFARSPAVTGEFVSTELTRWFTLLGGFGRSLLTAVVLSLAWWRELLVAQPGPKRTNSYLL